MPYLLPKTFKLFSFTIFWPWVYLMKIIPETFCVQWIRYLIYVFIINYRIGLVLLGQTCLIFEITVSFDWVNYIVVRLAHILGFMCFVFVFCWLYLQFYVVGLVLFMLLYYASTFLVSCCVFIYFVYLRPVYCVPYVSSVSGLPILYCPFFIADSVFSKVYLYIISISK